MTFLLQIFYGKIILWTLNLATIGYVSSRENCSDGEVRFNSTINYINETSASAGLLEVCNSNMWGTVCGASWDSIDSIVACRQMGYNNGYEIVVIDFRLIDRDVMNLKYGTAFRCSGIEKKLINCPHERLINVTTTVCERSSDVWLLCNEVCNPGEIRLIGTNEIQLASHGKVEACYEGQWWPICQDDIGLSEYAVMCRQLGFFSGYHNIGVDRDAVDALQFVRVIREDFISITLPFQIECTGNEHFLASCVKLGTFQYDCNGIDDQLELVCIDSNEAHNCTDGDLRLVGGMSPSEGRLEVCFNHFWGTVCDENWDDIDAIIACQQLGFKSQASSAISYDIVAEETGPIFMTNVRCRGTFSKLSECSFDDNHIRISRSCDHNNDVHLVCASNDHTINIVLIAVVIAVILVALLAILCASISLAIAITAIKKRRKDQTLNKQNVTYSINNFSPSTPNTVGTFPLFDDGMHTYEYIDNYNIASPTQSDSSQRDHHDHCIGLKTETLKEQQPRENEDYHPYAILESPALEIKSNKSDSESSEETAN